MENKVNCTATLTHVRVRILANQGKKIPIIGFVSRIISLHLPFSSMNSKQRRHLKSTPQPMQIYSLKIPEPVFVDLLRSPGIDSQHGGPVRQPYLSYRLARLHRLAKSIPWNRFLGYINIYKYGLTSECVL